MNNLLNKLFPMLIPINDAGNEFSVKPTKSKKGFIAKYINHDTLDMDELESELAKVKPRWQVSLIPESTSFDQKTGKKKSSPELLYFGPNLDTDESKEIVDLFG
tara:strand:- start:898 stop:1209 length:312 start_codon:yes stop_codon:yes gene_type:complete